MSNQSEIIVCRIKLIQGLLLSHSRALKRGNSSFLFQSLLSIQEFYTFA